MGRESALARNKQEFWNNRVTKSVKKRNRRKKEGPRSYATTDWYWGASVRPGVFFTTEKPKKRPRGHFRRNFKKGKEKKQKKQARRAQKTAGIRIKDMPKLVGAVEIRKKDAISSVRKSARATIADKRNNKRNWERKREYVGEWPSFAKTERAHPHEKNWKKKKKRTN